MIRNIIFDLDGVIRGIKNTSLNEIIPKKYHKEYEGVGLCDFVAKYLSMSIFQEWDKGNVSVTQVKDEILRVSDDYPEEVVKLALNAPLQPEHNFVYAPTIQLIKDLRKDGYRLFILSNMPLEVVNILPALIDLSLFEKTYFSCNAGLRKPDKRFYEKAMDYFKINIRDSIFIDDNLKNLEPFRYLGGYTFLFDNKNIADSIKELKNLL